MGCQVVAQGEAQGGDGLSASRICVASAQGRKSIVHSRRECLRLEWHAPHLIGRGHTPGHTNDQLLENWKISGGTTMPFCPILRT
jgi:hypothetical protein